MWQLFLRGFVLAVLRRVFVILAAPLFSLWLRLSYYFAHAFSVRGTRRNLGLQQPMVTDQCGMGWPPGLVGHFPATWTRSRPLDVDHLTNRWSQPLAAVLKRLKDELWRMKWKHNSPPPAVAQLRLVRPRELYHWYSNKIIKRHNSYGIQSKQQCC